MRNPLFLLNYVVYLYQGVRDLEEIIQIPTEKLLPNPYQPRKQFKSEDMLSLADSIKENGILQPLLCRQINHSDYYELIAGERRLRGAILANLQTVPCIIVDCEYEDSAVFSILENIQRADLNFFEEAQAISHLMNTFGMTQQQISKKLGKSQSALSNKLRLLRLPADVRYFIDKEGLTERHARALLKIDNEKDMWTTLRVITERHLNVEQTEAYIDSLTNKEIKHKKNVIKVFVYSDMDDKVARAVKYYGMDEKKARKEIQRIDKLRGNHYNYYTGNEWRDYSNYDICINSDVLGVENAADMIAKAVAKVN